MSARRSQIIHINKKNEGETKMKLGNLISKKESKHVVKQTNVQSGGQILLTVNQKIIIKT